MTAKRGGAGAGGDSWAACYEMLPRVSRTFALAIMGLREPLRGSVAVSYLLCRILDTVEDAPGLSTREREGLILPFLDFLQGREAVRTAWLENAIERLRPRSSPDDVALLRRSESVVAAFLDCPMGDSLAIARWVSEMGRGMVESSALMDRGGGVKVLPTMGALDRYCYFIAGTVGYLLTDLFFLESEHLSKGAYFSLQNDAEAFGLGLQKVNIIKDFRDDLLRGWCFVPADILSGAGLSPADLLDIQKHRQICSAMEPLFATASEHLRRGWRYLEGIPVEEKEIRLFLASSLLFAVRTLALAVENPSRLTSPQKLKISRPEVFSLVAACRTLADRPADFRRFYEKLSRPLAAAGPFFQDPPPDA